LRVIGTLIQQGAMARGGVIVRASLTPFFSAPLIITPEADRRDDGSPWRGAR